MSFAASRDTKEQVRQATDLVDLVSRSIRLRRQGKQFVGLCPWHDDARPSLQVNPDRQSWKCWVCNIGGDVFSFVMKREGVDFPEALRILAERAGIPLSAQRPAQPGSVDDKQTLYRAMAWAEEQFHRYLLEARDAHAARQYLQQRGISQESVAQFRLGFSPNSWQWLMDRARQASLSPAVLEAVGLVSRSQDNQRVYDRFRGRLIFSIRDTEHRPIAFGARILPGADSQAQSGPKYVNSPETRLFSKSHQLYALNHVRDTLGRDGEIVVVEGYTDVIMAHQHGITNVVAALGTALGERHVRLLQRFADRIVLVLDGDEAGQRRTNEVLELFVAGQVSLQILTLPAGLDPCDFIHQHGADAFRQLLRGAVDALEHKVRTVTAGLDIVADPDRAHRGLDEILRTMAGAPAPSHMAAESMRLREQQMMVRLAQRFHVDETALRARLAELRSAHKKTPVGPVLESQQLGLTPVELELFQILLVHCELAAQALEGLAGVELTSDLAKCLWQLYTDAGREQADDFAFTFESVLTLTEDATLKNVLVRLHDDAAAKAEVALEDAEERLSRLVRDFHFQRERLVQRQSLAALQQRDCDEKEELEVLQRIIENERNRQGISAPTDG